MNATSSRSHAIFSLTLTQKKYTGSSPPPVRSSSPLPPTGRSPSRLARPGSMYTGSAGAASRASSPTFGRPSTPSFATAMRGGAAGGLRPPSSLGQRHDGRGESETTDGNDWVTVVSKFHFVDLAGSERVSRLIVLITSFSRFIHCSSNGPQRRVIELRRVFQSMAGFWPWAMSFQHLVILQKQNRAPHHMFPIEIPNSHVYFKTPLVAMHTR